jgi:hypothetical protein
MLLEWIGIDSTCLLVLAAEFPTNEMTALQTLRALKSDPYLRCVPVTCLRLASTETRNLYGEQAACVIEFPSTLDALERTLGSMKDLWLSVARSPYEQHDVYPA